MNLDTIKKLIGSPLQEDVSIGMIHLARYIVKNGLEKVGARTYGISGLSRIDIPHHLNIDSWSTVHIRDKFTINLSGWEEEDEESFIVYRPFENLHYLEAINNFKKEIIYEE